MTNTNPAFARTTVVALLAIALSACGGGNRDAAPFKLLSGAFTLPDIPCTENTLFYVAGLGSIDFQSGMVSLSEGDSRRLFLLPKTGGATNCSPLIRSVVWMSDDPEVASMIPLSQSPDSFVWLTAGRSGVTRVGVDVTFLSGRTTRAMIEGSSQEQTELVRVSPRVFPGARRILQASELDLPAPGQAISTFAHVLIRVDSEMVVDMAVDWDSVGNVVSASVCQGDIAPSLSCPIRAIQGRDQGDQKPVVARASLGPGTYTLILVNHGPGAEHIRYEIGGTP